MTFRRLPALLLVGSVAVLAWYQTSRRKSDTASIALPSAPAHEQQGDDLSPEPPLQSPVAEVDARAPTVDERANRLRGKIVSVDRRPLPRTKVTWIALQMEDTESIPAWPMADWGVPQRESKESVSDGDGFFEFPVNETKELPFGSVLVAIHAEHYSGGLDLASDRATWPPNLEIVLEPATPVTVTVRDTANTPVVGASVLHAGKPRRPSPEHPLSIHERFYAQRAVTGANGRVEVAPFKGEQALWAEKGQLVSTPWQGQRPTSVDLTLGESFTIGGTITYPDLEEWEPGFEGERRVLVLGQTGNLWRLLVNQRDVQEGEWGPLRVPLAGVSRYKVRLEGIPITPSEELFDRPRPSSHRRIDFSAERGADLYLLAQDESGKPIPTAHGELFWDRTWSSKNRLVGEARPDGVLYLGTFPPGHVFYRVSAPGYATHENSADIAKTARFYAPLEKGGSIAGRCVHDGKPVEDFEIIYSRVEGIRVYRSASFLGRDDGSFGIESLRPGDWSLQAAGSNLPCGGPVTVRVDAERRAEVELELPLAIRGGGRVVGWNGEPVSNAHVQPYSAGIRERTLPWGPGAWTAPDGSFDLDAFVLGTNYITVEADGYATAAAEMRAVGPDFLDWGEIRLFRPQVLEVSLLELDRFQGRGSLGFRAATIEDYILRETPFDREGIIRFEGVPPGDHGLVVYYPDNSWAKLSLQLRPGEEWKFDLKVAGERMLRVHVVDSNGDELSFVPGVLLSAQEENGVLVLREDVTDDGHASFEGIRAPRAQVLVLDRENHIVASKDVTLGAGAGDELEIRLGEKALRVRVVDAARAPIPGARVRIRSSTGEEIRGVDETDAEGWADLVGRPAGRLWMDVSHDIAGRRFGVPIDASLDELEVVLVASGSIEVGLVDGDVPLAGVVTCVETTAGISLSDSRQTDDQGRVRYEALGEGTYHLGCRRADCWPALVDEELAPGEQARVQVQMRRLADLEFRLLSAGGLPVSGMPVEFTSVEFDLPIETWLEEERVRAPRGLTTDHEGAIRIEGLPRGEYSWSLTVGDDPLTGSFELAPAQVNRVMASLPPPSR